MIAEKNFAGTSRENLVGKPRAVFVGKKICVVAGCTTEAGNRKKMCNTCHDRVWRAKFPEHHLWNNLKKSAKKRGLAFTITLSWWISFCEMTGFGANSAKHDHCALANDPDDGHEPF